MKCTEYFSLVLNSVLALALIGLLIFTVNLSTSVAVMQHKVQVLEQHQVETAKNISILYSRSFRAKGEEK